MTTMTVMKPGDSTHQIVLVTGGRGFRDYQLIMQTLGQLHAEKPIYYLLHGAAKGADELAGQWASSQGIATKRFPADWKKHGKAAGPIRNKAMLEWGTGPTVVVAFPGGKGTANMVSQAKQAGVRVLEISGK